MEHFSLIPLGKQGLQERGHSLTKFRNPNSMLRILDSLISVKKEENIEQDANLVIELRHLSQHHPK